LIAYGVFVGLLAATCLWLVQGPIRAQHLAMKEAGWGWTHEMPDFTNPLKALWWPFSACFEVPRYCFYPAGGFLCGFVLLGAVRLIRNRDDRLTLLILGPVAGVVAAACLQRYPCGCDRPITFLTPTLALLVGYSAPAFFRFLKDRFETNGETSAFSGAKWTSVSSRLVYGLSVLLLLSPVAICLYRVAVPWPAFDCRGACRHVISHLRPGDKVVLNSWDQHYYYRGTDVSFCGRDALDKPEGHRCWLTMNLFFEDTKPPEKNLNLKHGWRIVEQKQFDLLVVFLLERDEGK
jgi:hypothetical protein